MKINTNKLLELFRLPSQSGREYKVQEYIRKELDLLKIQYEEDKMGNIYNFSNVNKPMLSAHMDTVAKDTDLKFLDYIHINRFGVLKGYGIIGADDKVGIHLILEILAVQKDLNFCFSVMEETGAHGAKFAKDDKNFKNVAYGLILDRMNSGDIICANSCNEYGTKDFENALASVGKNFGFKPAQGVFSDADMFSDKISCANLSVGYYNQHSPSEFLVISEMQNTLNFVLKFLKEFPNERFEAPSKAFSFYGAANVNSGHWSDTDWCEACGIKHEKEDLFFSKTLGTYLCYDCGERLISEINDEIYSRYNYPSDEKEEDFSIEF